MNIELLKEKFKRYVETFDMNEANIKMKYYHSLRVMDISSQLAIDNNFSEDDIKISTIVGLLHDYARFPQWTKYKTFSDIKSEDHAEWAIKLLFEQEEIKKYTEEIKYYDEIYDSIKYHNKLKIKENISEHNKLICNVIRDADKLDIFYILGKEKYLFKEDNEDISEELKIDFFNNNLLDRKKVKNNSDNILLNLSMVYDMNFDHSYKYLKDNRLIEKMLNNIDNKEKYKKYFEYILEFIEKKVGELC